MLLTPRLTSDIVHDVETVDSYGTWLKQQRTRRGLTQTQLAVEADISPTFVYQSEKSPDIHGTERLRAKLAAGLGMTLDEMVAAYEESQGVVRFQPVPDDFSSLAKLSADRGVTIPEITKQLVHERLHQIYGDERTHITGGSVRKH